MNHKDTKSTKVKSKNKKYFVYFVSLWLINKWLIELWN
jgi:hypothetical protein